MTTPSQPPVPKPHLDPLQMVTVTVSLPLDLVNALRGRAAQLQQSPTQLMVELLQTGLEASAQPSTLTTQPDPSPKNSSPEKQPALPTSQDSPRDRCPQCNHHLGAPLKSSGRQVCSQCGWSDRPRTATAMPQNSVDHSSRTNPTPSIPPSAAREVADAEIYRILAQASEESQKNMKPKKINPEARKQRISDFLNRRPQKDDNFYE